MRRGLMAALRRLRHDERGAALLLFTIFLVPMLAVTAVSIDLSRVLLVKQKLANAADAAALAVGAQPGLSDDEAKAQGEAFIRAHYPAAYFDGQLGPFNVIASPTQVDVTVTARIPTSFLKVLNVSTLDVTVSSQAVRAQRKLEIALVLDVTGSMLDPSDATFGAPLKIDALKSAAKDLVDIVVWDNQSDTYYSKVALVPYASAVNVGAYAAQVRGSVSAGTCTTPGCQFFRFTNASGSQRTHEISTCVSERVGAQAYTDAAPSSAAVGKNYPPATNNPCLPNVIVPLNSDKDVLNGAIEALQAAGSTAGHIGAAWGWYLLSPNFGYLWPQASRPAAYAELANRDAWGRQILQKIAVLMTDGEFNTSYCNGVISRDSGTGSGSAADHINCNAPNGSSLSQAQSLCNRMKTSGVTVFTVGFALTQPAATDLMQQCATDASHAYLAGSGEELKQAFRDIASRIVNLKLTH